MLESGVDLDEWYLAEFIELNVEKLSSEDAFDLTSYVLMLIQNSVTTEYLYELL